MTEPKPPGMRQRRNRASTRATLPSVEESAGRVVPILPGRPEGERWHVRVTDWWGAVWRSPMAAEYLDSDKCGLYMLAELHQRFWSSPGARTVASLAAEIRQQEIRFGLSPAARRRLQWEIERGETAADRTENRRKARAQSAAARKDPREVLKLMTDPPAK